MSSPTGRTTPASGPRPSPSASPPVRCRPARPARRSRRNRRREMAFETKTVQTHYAPVRYLVGGAGHELVFLHGAGGITADDPLLAELAKSHRVYAPLVPGYGDSEEAPEIRDMLDFTLHTWDVVKALGLKDPVLVGHSMGGMIAAEMAAVQPNDVSRLALIAP